jgi:hypothetical protein
MGSGAVIYSYVLSFIKICSGIQKLIGGGGGKPPACLLAGFLLNVFL